MVINSSNRCLDCASCSPGMPCCTASLSSVSKASLSYTSAASSKLFNIFACSAAPNPVTVFRPPPGASTLTLCNAGLSSYSLMTSWAYDGPSSRSASQPSGSALRPTLSSSFTTIASCLWSSPPFSTTARKAFKRGSCTSSFSFLAFTSSMSLSSGIPSSLDLISTLLMRTGSVLLVMLWMSSMASSSTFMRPLVFIASNTRGLVNDIFSARSRMPETSASADSTFSRLPSRLHALTAAPVTVRRLRFLVAVSLDFASKTLDSSSQALSALWIDLASATDLIALCLLQHLWM
mmetsp:Transcript_33125/g.58945  ORF Transcript_33125/g.58945 Transcript_33125/m.58945 type:complete len:292 (+) Transcript_33125:101-976(+)